MKICTSCKSEFGGGEVFCPNDGSRLVNASQYDGSAPGAEQDPLVGMLLAERYQILRQIGEGGMGLVYEAEHVAIEKRVALKVLRDDFSRRPEVVARFRQEAKSASKIGNEHIVDISDFGSTPSGASYFVMELLSGEDLAERLAIEGQLPVSRAADIILQCCKALGAAHKKGIVHRDMKPENIFLTEREGRTDFVKLVDFGIAKMSDIETEGAPGRKLTKTGMIFGTPEYMSPEQAAGQELDHRVDVYALAVIYFEMLTGRVPFVGDTFMGILTQHMFEDPPALQDVNPHIDVPPQIAAFIYQGMAKDPDERFQSCEEMAEALSAALAGQFSDTPTLAGYGEPVVPRHSEARPLEVLPADADLPGASAPVSRAGLIVLVGVVLLAAGIGAGVVLWLGKQTTEETPVVATPLPVLDAGTTAALVPPAVVDAGPPQGVDVDAGPQLVTISVGTSPVGARVFVEGRGEVCEATPCSFETPPNEPILVRASRGRDQGESEVTPTQNTTLQIAMRRIPPTGRRQGRRGNATPSDTNGGSSGRRGGSGDLKIPDIFRNN